MNWPNLADSVPTINLSCTILGIHVLYHEIIREEKITAWSLVHTSCECEGKANVDVTNSQRIFRCSSTLLNSLGNIAVKGRLWRQIHVKFTSHSHSQEVWTGLYDTDSWGPNVRPFFHKTEELIVKKKKKTKQRSNIKVDFETLVNPDIKTKLKNKSWENHFFFLTLLRPTHFQEGLRNICFVEDLSTVVPRWFQRWRRQRNKAWVHYPALVECLEEAWLRCVDLRKTTKQESVHLFNFLFIYFNINFGLIHIHQCPYTEFFSSKTKSQAHYSCEIQTHDLSNLQAVSYQLDHRDCPVDCQVKLTWYIFNFHLLHRIN